MSSVRSLGVARHVRDLLDRQQLVELGDPELLRRFLVDRNEAAFAAIVQRHGPMVLATCRRALHQMPDAEDACQAVFLVLSRKANTLRSHASLAGWLHRVAVRASSRLRAHLVRSRSEALPHDLTHLGHDEAESRDVLRVIDAEVARLPDRLRLPLVICYLQNRTRAEAAAELGWSEDTVRGRLERGRRLLQSRLQRKGLVLPAALVGLAPVVPLAQAGPTVLASRLAESLVRSAAIARAQVIGLMAVSLLTMGIVVGAGLWGPATAGSSQTKAENRPGGRPVDPNLDTLVLRIQLSPKGLGEFDLRHSFSSVVFYVPNLRLEPPTRGPDGKPTEAHVRITKEQAAKFHEALVNRGLFDDPLSKFDSTRPNAMIVHHFQHGEDHLRTERFFPWGPKMLPVLDDLRKSATGEAADVLDKLLLPLAEARSTWKVDINDDWKRLQGNWELPGASKETIRVSIDGNRITLKMRVQLDPLLDLDVIQGTFELHESHPRSIEIKGKRQSPTSSEEGIWRAAYVITDRELFLHLGRKGWAAPPTLSPRWIMGEVAMTLVRPSAPGAWKLTDRWQTRASRLQFLQFDRNGDSLRMADAENEYHVPYGSKFSIVSRRHQIELGSRILRMNEVGKNLVVRKVQVPDQGPMAELSEDQGSKQFLARWNWIDSSRATLSPDGRSVADVGMSWNELRIINLESKSELRPNVSELAVSMTPQPKELRFSPDSARLFAVGGHDYPVLRWKNGRVACWDVATGKQLWMIEEDNSMNLIGLSRDGQILVTAGRLGPIVVRDAETGKARRTISCGMARAMAISPDGSYLVYQESSPDGEKATVLNLLTPDSKPVQYPIESALRHIVFHPDGKSFVTADERGELSIWKWRP